MKFCSSTCRYIYNARPHIRTKEQAREYYSKHRKEILALASFRRVDLEEKLSSDPVYYAEYRRNMRNYSRKHNDKTRIRPYSERLSTRIPDYSVKGEHVLDETSTFLVTSLEKSAYGRELALSRGKQLGRFEDQ